MREDSGGSRLRDQADPGQQECVTSEGAPNLLPCPFCGDSAILGGVGGYHEVECTNCNVITRYSRSEAEVIAAWNARVALSNCPAPVSPSPPVSEANHPSLASAASGMRKALERIGAEHDCGCVPCVGQCRSQEALQATVDEMRAIARAALSKES